MLIGPCGQPGCECRGEIEMLRRQNAELRDILKSIVEQDLTYFRGFVEGGQILQESIWNGRAVLAKEQP